MDARIKLPPLNALRAFEAAARLGGIKQAAEELSVTPAAVSQQVRLLEDFLGQPLFDRLPRALRPTAAGLSYHQAVGRHLRGIAEATERLKPPRRAVSISVVPSLATLWLAPRLPRFMHAQPQVEVRVEAESELVDLRGGAFDLAIRQGSGRYPQCEAVRLFGVDLLPVASPRYLRTLRRGRRVRWDEARLLHEESNQNWADWAAAGELSIDVSRGSYFSHGMMALAAAAEGEGIALASYCLIEAAVRDGRLEVVESRAVPTGTSYWLAWPSLEVRSLRSAAALFRDWIVAQAAATQAGALAQVARRSPEAAVARPRAVTARRKSL
jgi:LysR family glycine cleavage system transcriptional activator